MSAVDDITRAVGGLVVLGLTIWGIALYSNEAGGGTNRTETVNIPINPQPEDLVLGLLSDYARRYATAPNDILRDRLPGALSAALCQALPDRLARGWLGKVERVDLTHNGWGLIIVSLNSHVTLTTPTLEIFDIDNQMSPPGAALTRSLETFRVGEQVFFSGKFTAAPPACVSNARLTEAGRLSDPLLAFQFLAMEHVTSATPSSALTAPSRVDPAVSTADPIVRRPTVAASPAVQQPGTESGSNAALDDAWTRDVARTERLALLCGLVLPNGPLKQRLAGAYQSAMYQVGEAAEAVLVNRAMGARDADLTYRAAAKPACATLTPYERQRLRDLAAGNASFFHPP